MLDYCMRRFDICAPSISKENQQLLGVDRHEKVRSKYRSELGFRSEIQN